MQNSRYYMANLWFGTEALRRMIQFTLAIFWSSPKWKRSLHGSVWLFVTPMDCNPPGSSVHGILQARRAEWVAIPFSRGSPLSKDRTQVSCIGGRFFTIWATREVLTSWLEREETAEVEGRGGLLRLLSGEESAWSLVQEDPMCCGAAKPVCRNYWACSLKPGNLNCWAHKPPLLQPKPPRTRASPQEEPRPREARAPQPGNWDQHLHHKKDPARPRSMDVLSEKKRKRGGETVAFIQCTVSASSLPGSYLILPSEAKIILKNI